MYAPQRSGTRNGIGQRRGAFTTQRGGREARAMNKTARKGQVSCTACPAREEVVVPQTESKQTTPQCDAQAHPSPTSTTPTSRYPMLVLDQGQMCQGFQMCIHSLSRAKDEQHPLNIEGTSFSHLHLQVGETACCKRLHSLQIARGL